jgi:ER protein Pkr1
MKQAGAPSSGAGGSATGSIVVSPPKTFIDNVIDSILTPGASSGLVATINAALIGLLFVLVWWAFMEGTVTIHTGLLAFFAVGLLGSFNWFLGLMRDSEEVKEEILEAAGVSTSVKAAQAARGSSGADDQVVGGSDSEGMRQRR